jgi:hypothetical protein
MGTDERELGRDEERVNQDQDEHPTQQQGGHDPSRLVGSCDL